MITTPEEEKLELVGNRLKELQEEVLTKTKEVADLEVELGEARKAREYAFEQKRDMEKQAFEAEQKRDELKSEVSRLQTLLAKHEEEHDAHRVYHESMTQNIRDAQEAHAQKESELHERMTEHAKKEKELEENRAEVEHAREVLSRALEQMWK